jgi:hypothetical protein
MAENEKHQHNPVDSDAGKFEEVNTRQNDMGFASADKEARNAGKNKMHYSHATDESDINPEAGASEQTGTTRTAGDFIREGSAANVDQTTRHNRDIGRE